MDLYQTNKNEKEVDVKVLNNAIDMIDIYFDDMTQEKFLVDFDNIISTLINISNQLSLYNKYFFLFKLKQIRDCY